MTFNAQLYFLVVECWSQGECTKSHPRVQINSKDLSSAPDFSAGLLSDL